MISDRNCCGIYDMMCLALDTLGEATGTM